LFIDNFSQPDMPPFFNSSNTRFDYSSLPDCEELVEVVDVFYYEFVILLNLFDVPLVLQIQVILF